MEEQVYPEYRPCIGWPQFREVYKQTLMEDESQQRRLQEWGASPLTAESVLLSPERVDVLFNSPQLD